ncbi:Spy/CpxP family protein refolding chaperone [Marinobacter confluentis]|uniref:Periplasmic heavy metal sensor n=1 Tax=Marinobacter confluentis TaxID=1697557 RepID=A0A4Z1C3B8_9GAMM|nr:Spy/CpxP family protein refolding chaperone [Marinobacter confluentis]TGN41698.1 periplasmic heavy metal sensor [Marinobacter confluentis]
MKLQKRSSIWLSLTLCLGLSGTAFIAHAQDDAASGTDPNGAKGMQHHSPHGKDYKGHHGKGHHSGHHGMGGKGTMHQRVMIELDLDESQLEDIAAIQKELRSELTELKAERYEQSLKLQELYAAEELDAGDITEQQQRVFDAIKEITELQVEAQQDMRDLLTDDQRSKLLRSGDWMMPN